MAFDPDVLRSRLRELAFLNSRATILFRAHKGEGNAGGSPDSHGHHSAVLNGHGNGVAAGRRSRTPAPVAAAAAGRRGSSASPAPAAWEPGQPWVKYVSSWTHAQGIPSAAGEGAEGAAAGAAKGKATKPKRSRKEGGAPAATGQATAQGSIDGAVVDGGWQVFHYKGGLQEFVTWLNKVGGLNPWFHGPLRG